LERSSAVARPPSGSGHRRALYRSRRVTSRTNAGVSTNRQGTPGLLDAVRRLQPQLDSRRRAPRTGSRSRVRSLRRLSCVLRKQPSTPNRGDTFEPAIRTVELHSCEWSVEAISLHRVGCVPLLDDPTPSMARMRYALRSVASRCTQLWCGGLVECLLDQMPALA
jgi:hypothetical protein